MRERREEEEVMWQKKYSDMRDPHVPHQQNHQQNSFDVVKGGNLAGIESLGM